jgi:hypothetical protein
LLASTKRQMTLDKLGLPDNGPITLHYALQVDEKLIN